jgi:TusE/DsrC/DsvC family sulfur relay protein
MSITTYAGTTIAVDDEGFFEDPAQWTEEMAPEIAKAQGIDELTDKHWQVIRFMREQYLTTGTGPTVRVLGKTSGVTVKELYQLFPKGPAKVAAKIAGILKPRGCI